MPDAPVQIKEAARLTGVKPTTLRMWEKRYGWPQPVILSNGYREYPADLIAQIKAVKDRLDRGDGPIGEAIQVVVGTVKR